MKYCNKMSFRHYIALVLGVLGIPLSALAQGPPSMPEGITTLGADTIFCPDINQGDTVFAVFYIANYGKSPVKIYQVHPGCQCTTPEFHDTLFPNQIDSIVLVFYSKNNHEDHFMKGAIVLNNVAEKNYFVTGKMNPVIAGSKIKNKRIRLNNQTPVMQIEDKKVKPKKGM